MGSISDLSELSSRLNQATDNLNVSIKFFEESVGKLNLGYEVWVKTLVHRGDMWEEHGEQCQEITRVGWAKIGSDWRLSLKVEIERAGLYQGDENCPYVHHFVQKIYPVLEANRTIRARAATLLEGVVDELLLEGQRILDAVEASKKIRVTKAGNK